MEEQLNQTMPTAPPTPSGPQPRKLRLKYLFLDLVVLIVLATIGWWLFGHHNHGPTHQLNGLSSYTLSGKVAGRGITFQKPSQLVLDTDPRVTLLPTEVGFNYVINAHSAAYIAAESPVTTPHYDPSDYLPDTSVQKWLDNPSSPVYAPYAQYITAFITSTLAPGINVSYTSAKIFTNPNIKSNAWLINFTLRNTTTGHTAKGQLIYAVGHNGYYLFYIDAMGNDWQANQASINQIFNSIKIDQ